VLVVPQRSGEGREVVLTANNTREWGEGGVSGSRRSSSMEKSGIGLVQKTVYAFKNHKSFSTILVQFSVDHENLFR
jgi:hypothetical protein